MPFWLTLAAALLTANQWFPTDATPAVAFVVLAIVALGLWQSRMRSSSVLQGLLCLTSVAFFARVPHAGVLLLGVALPLWAATAIRNRKLVVAATCSGCVILAMVLLHRQTDLPASMVTGVALGMATIAALAWSTNTRLIDAAVALCWFSAAAIAPYASASSIATSVATSGGLTLGLAIAIAATSTQASLIRDQPRLESWFPDVAAFAVAVAAVVAGQHLGLFAAAGPNGAPSLLVTAALAALLSAIRRAAQLRFGHRGSAQQLLSLRNQILKRIGNATDVHRCAHLTLQSLHEHLAAPASILLWPSAADGRDLPQPRRFRYRGNEDRLVETREDVLELKSSLDRNPTLQARDLLQRVVREPTMRALHASMHQSSVSAAVALVVDGATIGAILLEHTTPSDDEVRAIAELAQLVSGAFEMTMRVERAAQRERVAWLQREESVEQLAQLSQAAAKRAAHEHDLTLAEVHISPISRHFHDRLAQVCAQSLPLLFHAERAESRSALDAWTTEEARVWVTFAHALTRRREGPLLIRDAASSDPNLAQWIEDAATGTLVILRPGALQASDQQRLAQALGDGSLRVEVPHGPPIKRELSCNIFLATFGAASFEHIHSALRDRCQVVSPPALSERSEDVHSIALRMTERMAKELHESVALDPPFLASLQQSPPTSLHELEVRVRRHVMGMYAEVHA